MESDRAHFAIKPPPGCRQIAAARAGHSWYNERAARPTVRYHP